LYTLGFDIGSSSVKVALVHSETGKQVITLQEPADEMEISSPQPNWAEQNPELWWKHLCTASKRAITEAKIDAAKITAVGIAYQMHGLVLVDAAGKLLKDAIIWCDSRAVAIGNEALNSLGNAYCESHLLNAPGNFTASKLKWVQENQPEIYERIYKLMLPGDYIAYRLTGTISTTKNALSEGIFWDYKKDELAKELLAYYDIDEQLIPDILENFSDQGKVKQEAASATGLPVGIPIRYKAGDQPNNALALNVFKAGEVAVTGGTSGVVYAVTDNLRPKEIERVNHFAHVNYSTNTPLIGRLLCINGAGIQFNWLRKFSGAASYKEMNMQADTVAVGAEGAVVIPFGNGAERMLNNKNIGTQILNINLNIHAKSHLYRAALEGIAFSFIYGMDILKKDGTQIDVIRAGNDNLFQSEIFATTVATLLGHDIEIYDTTGAVGAARAAGLTDANFEKFGVQSANHDHVRTYTPLTDKAPYLRAYENWVMALEKLLK